MTLYTLVSKISCVDGSFLVTERKFVAFLNSFVRASSGAGLNCDGPDEECGYGI
jgi:hypothetical protein